ncbi:hypothetical protein S7335_5592 [Synechococcus sp. PCC 7335]|uniref:hypothetical protein n=1 Tax=Synechococcus sp. (strain ATCC 29403 / PCC 7335) TaxID=91464 RepID=UPI00017EB84E|nr:hypothetical protein [Synechococcus sp. PCC 7335]EDX87879.1 hypothetical protein S7335_5592 [Synechococcus sp. PCC 7335]
MLKFPNLFVLTLLPSLLGWTSLYRSAQAAQTKLGMAFELSQLDSHAINSQAIKALPNKVRPAAKNPHHRVNTTSASIESYEPVPVPNVPIPIESDTLGYAQELLPPFPPKLTNDNTDRLKPEHIETKPIKPEPEQLPHAKANDIGLRFSNSRIAIKENNKSGTNSSTSALSPLENADTATIASRTVTSDSVNSRSFSSNPVSLKEVKLSFEPTNLDSVSRTSAIKTALTKSSASGSIPFDPPPDIKATSLDGTTLDDWIFLDGSNSLVARTVGSAEGTRHWSGDRTNAYYGHIDPGNGVWNLGTFSYQHGANSPEEADRKQLQRLKRQSYQIEEQATRLGIQLSLEEKLNALDLANQAPLAALDKGGYIERLAQARRLKMKGEEAILWARTYAYHDPHTRNWNAPGLGNNVRSISRDQERRISAVSKALKAFSPNEKAHKLVVPLPKEPASKGQSARNNVPSVVFSPTPELMPITQGKRAAVSNVNSSNTKVATSLKLPDISLANSSTDESELFSLDANQKDVAPEDLDIIEPQSVASTSNLDDLKTLASSKTAQHRLEKLQRGTLPREGADEQNKATKGLPIYRIENRILP